MEGATSFVTNIGEGWVKKTLKRSVKRSSITPMEKQLEVQTWSAGILKPENGFKLLFTPAAKPGQSKNTYLMEKINISRPIEKIEEPKLVAEVLNYFSLAKQNNLYPSDFELYEQPDGRIALVDFDKYGQIEASGTDVIFPFRGKIPIDSVPMEVMYSEDLSKNIKNIMKGGSRKKMRLTKRKTRKTRKTRKVKYYE
jgi:hypothetical protein